VRWAADQYAADEQAFFRALTVEPTLTGVANLSARAGRNFPDMLRDWTLATTIAAEYRFVPMLFYTHHGSWDLGDMLRGMARDFPGLFYETPVNLKERFCADGIGLGVAAGGSAAMYEFDDCQGWKNYIALRAPGGGVLDAKASIGIVKVR
jgi:hypothetical protein